MHNKFTIILVYIGKKAKGMLPSHTLRTQQSLMNFRRDFAASYNITHKRTSWVRFFETDNTYMFIRRSFRVLLKHTKSKLKFCLVCVATLRHIRFTLIIPNTHMHSYIRNSAFIIKQDWCLRHHASFKGWPFLFRLPNQLLPCTHTEGWRWSCMRLTRYQIRLCNRRPG